MVKFMFLCSGDTESMSTGSRNSNSIRHIVDRNRNTSPKTDLTEYRNHNPRDKARENGPLMSPRTEKSNDSRVSSESRGRSKEFTFRWNAPSRNISPEATEK